MSFREFRKAGHTPTLMASLIHFDVSFLVWVLIGALGAYIATDLGLSAFQKGLMVAVPPLGGSVFRLLLGTLADRAGLKRVGLTSMALTAVPLLWGALAATTFAEVLVIGVLLGIAGASFAVALPLASRWYPPEHQGTALGIAGAGNSGTVIAALAAPRLAEHVGWHGVFGLALVPVAVAWVLFFVLAREPERPLTTAPARNALAFLAEADARWLCAFYTVTFGGFVGLSGYLPIFFVDRFGLAKVTAGAFAALCAVAGSLLRPLGGALADRRGGTTVLTAVLGGVAALTAALATQPRLALTIALLFATMAALGTGNGALFQIVPQRFPRQVGAVTGLIGAAGGVGGFLLPFGFGWLRASTGGFGTGFAVMAGVAVTATVAVRMRQVAWRRTWALEVAV